MKLRELISNYCGKNERLIDIHYFEDKDTVQPISTLTEDELNSKVYSWTVVFDRHRETMVLVVVI